MIDPTAGLWGEYPPPAFYFRVVFAAPALMADTSFQEVSGLNAEVETEEVVEGGENRYVQRLPKGVKHPPLELKRGMASVFSPLVRWCRQAMEGELMQPVVLVPLTVYLMNADKFPIRAWLFADAFPIKWEVESFGSTKNEVAIEKIVLSYSYSYRLI
jgi:phage tail-like protein